MAQKYITQLIDDLDGTTADQTITLALDGTDYIIDLNDTHATELRDTFKPYIDAARKADHASPNKTKTKTKNNKQDLAAIRAWAKDNGHDIADRGRISATITDAYNNAH